MDIGQIQNPFTQPGFQQAQGPAPSSFAGQQITASDPMSLVADSAEEASFAMSEREEARLEERKMKPKGPNMERLEQVEKYIELMDKQDQRKQLDALVSSLGGKSTLTPRDALDEALKFFKDPGDAYTALAYAGKQLGGQFGAELFAEALDQMQDLLGTQVKTRLAAGVAALQFPDLGEAKGLQNLYSRAVLDLGSAGEIFDRIMTDYGEDRFEEALDFLTKSLGNDMSATTSSTDKVRLSGLGRDLGTVQQLHGLNIQCKQLAARLLKTSDGQCGMTSTGLVKEILKLRDAKFVGAFDIEAIADKAGMKKIEDRIGFFQDFSNMARQLSENLFDDNNGRLSLIQATQAALDDAIAVEEQLYED